jgi:hypothetical protein
MRSVSVNVSLVVYIPAKRTQDVEGNSPAGFGEGVLGPRYLINGRSGSWCKGRIGSTTLICQFSSRVLPMASELVALPIAFHISDRTRFEKAPADRNAFLS